MIRNFAIAGLVVALAATSASATIRIDFSDDTLLPTPGYRISNADGMGISERFEFGSNVAFNGDGLDFQRITWVQGGAADVVDFIVVLPEFTLAGPIGFEPITGATLYGVTVPPESLFTIYHVSDSGLTDPLLIADMAVYDPFLAIGASGNLEPYINPQLTNISVVNNGFGFEGSAFPSLVTFASKSDADFVGTIVAAGLNIAARINAGLTTVGASAGSVPEPTTIGLLVIGAAAALRRRVR